MEVKSWTARWWEILVVLMGVNSLFFGVGGMAGGYPGFAFLMGFGPAALFLTGLALIRSQRTVASVMIILGSLGAALAWWVIYTIVFGLIIVVGGFQKGKIGFQGAGPETAT